MGSKKIMECSIMEEVREMRRKISEEFGHDLGRLVAYYQELETEMRKSGKYKFVDPPSEKPGSEEVVFDSLVSVQLDSEEFEVIKTLAKSRGISPANLIREWVVQRIDQTHVRN
ncbi:MAG: hypothetical protein OXN25_04065 [Candidatus Poribacteria bacterium]|nr:hypothetical protein [Candidatus Poribacteria bacterium]